MPLSFSDWPARLTSSVMNVLSSAFRLSSTAEVGGTGVAEGAGVGSPWPPSSVPFSTSTILNFSFVTVCKVLPNIQSIDVRTNVLYYTILGIVYFYQYCVVAGSTTTAPNLPRFVLVKARG